MTPFEILGGEAGLRHLVDRFYHHMDTLPEAATIRAMHPADLGESAEKLFLFLQFRFGGPETYIQQRGHPRLRARHFPWAIGQAEADAWMLCMDKALEECFSDPPVRAELHTFFAQVAANMRNQPG